MFTIEDHIVHPSQYIASPNVGGMITPKFLVMHFTAINSMKGVVSWFRNPASKVSCHLNVDLDGSIVQMVPLNVKAWHAGKSQWRGHTDLNAYSIGIELINYGPTPFRNETVILTREGRNFDGDWGNPENWLAAEHPLEPGRKQWWQRFERAQFDTLDALVPLLVDTYNLREVVGHEEIATPRGRKTDPGPAFPLGHYKEYADHGNAGSEGRYTVTAETLNVRGGPGVDFKVLTSLRRGDTVKVLHFEGNWALVVYDTTNKGYAHKGYLMKT